VFQKKNEKKSSLTPIPFISLQDMRAMKMTVYLMFVMMMMMIMEVRANAPTMYVAPPTFVNCKNQSDIVFAQELYNFDNRAMVQFCALVNKTYGGWDGCNLTPEFIPNAWRAINDSLAGLCNAPINYNTMYSRFGLANGVNASLTFGYFALCQPNNLGVAINCRNQTCNFTQCPQGQICNYTGIITPPVCVCNDTITGVYTLPPCLAPTPSPHIIYVYPNSSNITSAPTAAPLPPKFVQDETILLLVLAVVLAGIATGLFFLARHKAPTAQRWILFSVFLSLYDLCGDLVLIYSLWIGDTPHHGWEPPLMIACVCTGILTGMAVCTYVFVTETKYGDVTSWVEKSPTRAGICLIMAAIDPSNMKLFSSKLRSPTFNCPWSEKGERLIDIHGSWVVLLEDFPELAVKISLVTMSHPTLLSFILLVGSVFSILHTLSRKVALFSLFMRLRPHKRALASFETGPYVNDDNMTTTTINSHRRKSTTTSTATVMIMSITATTFDHQTFSGAELGKPDTFDSPLTVMDTRED